MAVGSDAADRGVDVVVSDPAGWSAAVAESVPGASVLGVHRLGGGTTAETFAVETNVGEVVVKRYRRSRREAIRSEWHRLRFVQRVEAPVPRPLALDDEGRWFGVPAVAMTRLNGRLDVRPGSVDEWIQQLASALATIHATDTTGADGPSLRRPTIQTWRPPTLRQPSPLAERTVEVIRRHLPDVTWQPVLTHGDFHPGNTLWQDGLLTGIVDWTESRLGPAASELAYCRTDIALLLGQDPADRLASYYAEITGAVPAHLPIFDLVWGLDAHRKSARILNAHRAQGCVTTPDEFASRTTTFLEHALAELASS